MSEIRALSKMHRTVFGSFSDVIGLNRQLLRLKFFKELLHFRSLTRDHQDSKQRNTKHALIKLCQRFEEHTKLFSEDFGIK